MSIAVELPALGESVVEGTVAQWLVAEGDTVELDQPLVEVTTDKVDAEIPSPAAGVIEKILVPEGETVEVGAQLATITTSGAAVPASERRATRAGPAAATSPDPAGAAPADTPKATPVARRLADEARLELDAIEGTGASGRITKSDVMRHSAAPVAASSVAREPAAPAAASRAVPVAPVAGGRRPSYAHYALQDGDRVIPMTPQRKLIAEHMVYSKRVSPHVGTVAEVDLGRVVALRQRWKREFEETHGVSLTFLPFIVHAAVRALREHPRLNASVVDDAIVEKKDVHIGIAVEAEKGLVVPVVRSADRLSLAGLAAAIDDLSLRARSKKLSPDELRGGTFTISNPGRRGNLYGFAIINQPQVAILRLGEIVKRPVVVDRDGEDAIVIRPMMHLALSYDHRAVDGAPANAFLYRVRELLEAPEVEG